MSAKSLANVQVVTYDVTWKGVAIGWAKDVDPSALKPRSIEKKIGELLDLVVDRVRVELTGTLKTMLHEVATSRIRQLMPWAAASGSFSLSPTTFTYSEYENSGALVLTPRGGVAADAITLVKAFPVASLPKSANGDFGTFDIEWNLYPDQAALTATSPTLVYGYRGPVPT